MILFCSIKFILYIIIELLEQNTKLLIIQNSVQFQRIASNIFIYGNSLRIQLPNNNKMIIERESNRRQREQIYRKQLLQDIQEKQQQKQIRNKSKVYLQAPRQQFSLITNIQAEQERRRNKQKQYYEELERQRAEAIELKKKKIEQQKIQQQKMDEKIRRQNQVLKQKYEEEIRKERNKKDVAAQNKFDSLANEIKIPEQKQDRRSNNKIFPKDIIDHHLDQSKIQYFPDTLGSQENYHQFFSNVQSYPYLSRAENQDYNFPPRKVINNSYYKQLLHQKRKLQEETDSLRDLNRIIHSDTINQGRKYSNNHDQSGGIKQLKQISKLIFDQSQFYVKDSQNYRITGGRSKTQNSRMNNSQYYRF